MLAILVGAVATLIGVLIGGAIRAWEAKTARKMDADALLSALVAEVEAITRLIDHRQFIAGFIATRAKAELQIQLGQGNEVGEFLVISLDQNYFATYEASLSKIGLIDPYWADRITRFYTFLKAVRENYSPSSPFTQKAITAQAVHDIITNDLTLLHTVVVLGEHIGTQARKIAPPKGVTNPFDAAPNQHSQPALPQSHPELANAEAGSSPSLAHIDSP